MQRHCSGCAFTGSGSITSSTTGRFSGKRATRSLRERSARSFSGAATMASTVALVSGCSEQLQLVPVQLFAAGTKDPLDQQINLLTQQRILRRLCNASGILNWLVSSCSRGVIGCKL